MKIEIENSKTSDGEEQLIASYRITENEFPQIVYAEKAIDKEEGFISRARKNIKEKLMEYENH